MAMSITVMRSVAYLLDTCQTPDGPAGGPVAYFTQDGTWPGRWGGAGLSAVGLSAGTRVDPGQATALLEHGAHPITGEALGRPRLAGDAAASGTAVGAFDLTFTIPKSVSVLWAVADADTRQAIWDAHHAAIDAAVDWASAQVLRTRSGRGGVAVEATRGMLYAAFDHFESRDGDPHLHTHVALANRVQRARDGAWRTVDGKSLLRGAVAVSEHHENLLLDLLHERLGLQFTERARPRATSKAVVLDVAGIGADVVAAFSSRDKAVSARLDELCQAWSAEHGGAAPPRRVVDSLKLAAWAATRAPKKTIPDSLSDLTTRWRRELATLGTDPRGLVTACIGHPVRQVAVARISSDPEVVVELARLVLAAQASTDREKVSPDQVPGHEVADYLAAAAAGAADAAALAEVRGAAEGSGDGVVEQVSGHLGAIVHARLAAGSSTWTAAGAFAAAARLTRSLRTDPAQRAALTDVVASAALKMCVPLTAQRYRLPPNATNLVAVGGASVFDDPGARVFTSRVVLDAEAAVHDAATTALPRQATGALDPDHARAALAAYTPGQGRTLAADQVAAVAHLACAPPRVAAMVGAAGTGKTTSLRALRDLWADAHGEGRVLALAPSARAASVLRGELDGVDAMTVAGFLTATTPAAKADRTRWIARCRTRAHAARNVASRARAGRALAAALAQDASVTVRPGSLVIVDEAAMATTADLAAVLAEVESAGARMVLVGDPAQLDAVGAGGILGRLDRTGLAARLTSIFRFTDRWQATASTRLRAGDTTVVAPCTHTQPHQAAGPCSYDDAGWVHEGHDSEVSEGAYAATQSALAAGRDAVLLVATNADLFELNTRATLERRAAGTVDTSRLVPLRAGADAGVGDLVVTRRNEAKITDSTGARIENGQLLRVEKITDDGRAICRRTGTPGTDARAARVTLPATYLAEDVELGYALTAHRAQGITVDEAHLVIPYGARMTRELIYVAMTRARGANHVWTGLPDADQLRAEHTPAYTRDENGDMVPVQPTATDVLARALTATRAQTTAHETAAAETERTSSLALLAAEHAHLVHLAAEEQLRDLITDLHGTDHAAAYWADEGPWQALVATFARAHALHPERTTRLLALPHHRDVDPAQGELDLFGPAPAPGAPASRRTHPAGTGAQDHALDSTAPTAPTAHDLNLDLALDESLASSGPVTGRPQGDTEIADGAGGGPHTPDDTTTAAPDEQGARGAALLAHWTLNAAIVNPHLAGGAPPGWVTGLTPPIGAGPSDVVDLAHQAQALIAARQKNLARQVICSTPPGWVDLLPACPEAALDPDGAAAWQDVATQVAAYRDTFTIETPDPLGPEPEPGFQSRARALVATAIDQLTTRKPARPPAPWNPPLDPHADPDHDWAEPEEVSAPTRAEARQRAPWWTEHDRAEPADASDADLLDGDVDEPTWWEPAYTLPAAARRASTTPRDVDLAVDVDDLLRLAAVNTAALDYWTSCAQDPKSWVPAYLANRALDTAVTPAHAPPGWTSTYNHLRAHGFTDADLLDAGLATRTRQGTLVDRFRDRAVIPIHDQTGRIAGFTARANPHDTDPRTAKYLNTPTTALFDKSTLLAGLTPRARAALAAGAVPVIVEGALDAAAVTAAGRGTLVGVAPCGTALTTAQLTTLATAREGHTGAVVLGFDDDTAGHSATARTWDLLDPRDATTARSAQWNGHKDPAALAAQADSDAVLTAITNAQPLVTSVIEERLREHDLSTAEGRVWAARTAAATAVATLEPETMDAAGQALRAALTSAGIETDTAKAIWDRAHTEALVAYSQAADHRPDDVATTVTNLPPRHPHAGASGPAPL
ncbi:MobF family relaxase [Cellulomonas triticagri]|uniref:Toprim domain-containing protein n=1 Tax=Cellulomonas triticagri TaxID=2483352 RepID=A0A3M2JLX5_9CELL|nr:MobF family relaxase [Cellulomonas triticagri]RMI13231.1 toprim domain-containing protein [Cellulomonas triticagri]